MAALGCRGGRDRLPLGGDAIDDIVFLKVTAIILIMVIIATMAQTDPNNPMMEIGIPFNADSFNIYALGASAPQIPLIASIDFGGPANATEKVCWISWWCPDLPSFDEIAQILYTIAISVTNFIFTVINGIVYGATVIFLLVANFVAIFNFVGWGAFQGNTFLLLFAVALTALLGGSVILWIYSKITGSIPFLGGG